MFGGTELYQAYDQGYNPSLQQQQTPQQTLDINDFSNDTTDTPQLTQSTTTQQKHNLPLREPIYDASASFKEAQLQQQLENLQGKLQQNKESKQYQNNDSMFDRFVSKKKDVLKLVTMSLTILLAISSHYVMTDLLRNYIANNDLTGNQEFTTKIAYPMTILLLIWTLKVFNR